MKHTARLIPPLLCFAVLTAAGAPAPEPPQTTVAKAPPAGDPFLWLEDKDGARAMAWVREQNARSLPVLEHDPHYATFYAQALKINESETRIPAPEYLRGEIYNFWQDAKHVRGIWRRTTVQSYRSASPSWTTVLDLDALARREHANWVWRGASCEYPAERRCLMYLSDGGEDAVTIREFDLTTRSFVSGGFFLPRAKQNVAWIDANTLLVSRPWTPGEVTASGYPYVVKLLRRGQPLSSAVEVFRGTTSDISCGPFAVRDGAGSHITFITRGVSFFNDEYFVLSHGALHQLAIPQKSQIQGLVDGRLLVSLDEPWSVDGRAFAQGSLVSIDNAATDPGHPRAMLVYAPGPRDSFDDASTTQHDVLVVAYHNVRARAYVYMPSGTDGWARRALALPDNATFGISDTSLDNDRFYLYATSFLMPTTMYEGDASSGAVAQIKAVPPQFDASRDIVEQHWATSRDGTKIPYFIVRPKNMRLNGRNPTVLTAYGGFQISMTPSYSGVIGKLWLEHGGVYVLANIRGGGEFGPAWHEAGLKTHRQRIYDDFYAVGRDLVARKITDPRHLGIVGGSNGGLLMGVEFTEHPDMWNAVQIEVPLLDMLRYEHIEAGASWVAEYGSVSVPAERAFLEKISPYQNLRGGVAYPEPFIWTTTKDDRVGPEHARKFAAKLAAMGVPYLFYEVTEGGHAAGANIKESTQTQALGWTYFTMKLME